MFKIFKDIEKIKQELIWLNSVIIIRHGQKLKEEVYELEKLLNVGLEIKPGEGSTVYLNGKEIYSLSSLSTCRQVRRELIKIIDELDK